MDNRSEDNISLESVRRAAPKIDSKQVAERVKRFPNQRFVLRDALTDKKDKQKHEQE